MNFQNDNEPVTFRLNVKDTEVPQEGEDGTNGNELISNDLTSHPDKSYSAPRNKEGNFNRVTENNQTAVSRRQITRSFSFRESDSNKLKIEEEPPQV